MSRSLVPLAARALPLAVIAAVLAAWQIVSVTLFTRQNGSFGAVPPPLVVLRRVAEDMFSPGYVGGLLDTTGAALAGYLIALAIALLLGVVVLTAPPLEPFANQLGVVAACVPVAAVSPIVVLLSPTGSRAVSVVLAILSVQFPLIVSVLLGLRAASPSQIDLIHAYGGGTIVALRRVRIIAAIPALLVGLRIGAPAAFLGAMTGEFFAVGVDAGAGRLLISQQYAGDYVGMWSVAILATLVSALGYGAIALLGRWAAPWTAHLGGSR